MTGAVERFRIGMRAKETNLAPESDHFFTGKFAISSCEIAVAMSAYCGRGGSMSGSLE